MRLASLNIGQSSFISLSTDNRLGHPAEQLLIQMEQPHYNSDNVSSPEIGFGSLGHLEPTVDFARPEELCQAFGVE